jgi:hypothetical protein
VLNLVVDAMDGGEVHQAMLMAETAQIESKRIGFLPTILKKTSIDSRKPMNYIV